MTTTTTQPFTIAPCSPGDEDKAIGSAMFGRDSYGDPGDDVAEILPLLRDLPGWPGWFYERNNNTIYEAIYAIRERGDRVTPETVCGHLRRAGKLEAVGGEAEIDRIAGSVISGADARAAAEAVREKAIQRWALEIGGGIQWAAGDPHKSAGENLAEAIARLSRIAALTAAPGPGWRTIDQIGMQSAYRTGLHVVTSGFSALDHALRGGFRQQSVYPLAGRTGSAKSTLALNMARREAVAGHSVLYFKLEESDTEAVYRLHAMMAQVRLKVLLDGVENANQDDQERLADAWDILRELPIRLAYDRSIEAIERISRRHVQDGGQIIFIDQLSMVEVPDTTIGYERATAVSNRLRLLARDLNVPIVVVCQVNRPASRADGHLSCHDLRDSGAIENDAAAVLLIDRARDPDGPQYSGCDPIRYLQIIIGKNRYGACTDPEKPIELLWYPTICHIEDTDLGGGAE